MTWIAQEQNTSVKVTKTMEESFEKAKREDLPRLAKNLDDQPLDLISFQPVKSIGLYEGEFAKRGANIIFHFWPYGYHQADSVNLATPKFKTGFKDVLEKAFTETFDKQSVEFSYDADVGAWFVKAAGWGKRQFWKELAIKACEALHKGLGGQPG